MQAKLLHSSNKTKLINACQAELKLNKKRQSLINMTVKCNKQGYMIKSKKNNFTLQMNISLNK